MGDLKVIERESKAAEVIQLALADAVERLAEGAIVITIADGQVSYYHTAMRSLELVGLLEQLKFNVMAEDYD